jgi:hypothetical protein
LLLSMHPCLLSACCVLQVGHDHPGANQAAGRVNKVRRQAPCVTASIGLKEQLSLCSVWYCW